MKNSEKKFPLLINNHAVIVTNMEKELLDTFIATGDIKETAIKAGMSEKEAKKFLSSMTMREYITKQVQRIAHKNDITVERVLERLHQVAFGELRVTKGEIKALEILAHFLNIIKPHTTNIKVGIAIENPIASKTDAELDELLRQHVQAANKATDNREASA